APRPACGAWRARPSSSSPPRDHRTRAHERGGDAPAPPPPPLSQQVGVLVCPFWLGDGEKLPLHVKSVVPPWLIVSVYVVNVTSAIDTRQLLFGHPACLGVTVGTAVVTSTPARPFFGLLIVWLPPAVTGTAGFWPGDSLPPG